MRVFFRRLKNTSIRAFSPLRIRRILPFARIYQVRLDVAVLTPTDITRRDVPRFKPRACSAHITHVAAALRQYEELL
jgi:hypothetical protein